jgi:hypothetical protein
MSEPADDGEFHDGQPSFAVVKYLMMELARIIDHSTLAREAEDYFLDYTKRIESTIQDYCLSLEYMVGILGKTNGKIIRVATALALYELAVGMLTPAFPELDKIVQDCEDQEDSYLPQGAAEMIKAQVERVAPMHVLKISLTTLQRAIYFIDVSVVVCCAAVWCYRAYCASS